MTDYQTDYQKVDQIFLYRYRDWECRQFDPETLLVYIQNLFAVNDYKYKTLAATLNLDYNPIENYRMTESGTDVHTGTDDTTSDIGSQTVTGSQSLGQTSQTATNNVSPMDSSTYVRRDQQIIEQNPVQNATDQTVGERKDETTATHDLTIQHDFTRSGNIGVTTSQQMLESERQVALFNLYNVIWNDIIKEFFMLGRIQQLGGWPRECDFWNMQ